MMKKNIFKAFAIPTVIGLCGISFASCDDSPDLPKPGTPDVDFTEIKSGTLFYCDFQDQNILGSMFTVADLDGNTPSSSMQSLGFSNRPGQVVPWVTDLRDTKESTNIFCGSTSQYNPAGQANDWLITRQIDIPDAGYMLEWKSVAVSPKKRDGLKVFISTTGGDPTTDFPAEPVFEVEEEVAGNEDETVDDKFATHSVSLDAYAGKSIWIAFVNQSYDKYILCIDDIRVFYNMPYSISSTTDRYAIGKAGIKGEITAITEPITQYSIHYTAADSIVRSEHYSGLNIAPGESHAFAFGDSLNLTTGEINSYQIWATIEGKESFGLTDSVGAISRHVNRKVVLEEGTFFTCGYCPGGIVAAEYIYKNYPDNFIAINVHFNDAVAVNSYASYLGFSAAPTGYINRKYFGAPLASLANGNAVVPLTFEGDNTFLSLFRKAKAEATVAEITGLSASLNANTKEINATAQVSFAMNLDNLDLNIAFVVIENDVAGYSQSNNYSGFSSPTVGVLADWGKGGTYGSSTVRNYTHQEVARGIFPSPSGRNGVIPSSVSYEEVYTCKESFISPSSIKNTENVKVIALLIDNESGEIINANIADLQ